MNVKAQKTFNERLNYAFRKYQRENPIVVTDEEERNLEELRSEVEEARQEEQKAKKEYNKLRQEVKDEDPALLEELGHASPSE